MLFALLLSFIAGLLTVLAPCILPLLPVILGGSFDPKQTDKRRPYIIAGSLVLSLMAFTLLLRATTAFIEVPTSVWSTLAGGLIILLGLFTLLPQLWPKVIGRLGIEHRSQILLGRAYSHKSRTTSAVLTGAALGPVFSSCSPTYAWVLASVLPVSPSLGLLYLLAYCLGVAVVLLAIALVGRRLLQRIAWASNPNGWFQRVVGLVFILTGIFVLTGLDKQLQTWLVQKDALHLIRIEQKLVPN